MHISALPFKARSKSRSKATKCDDQSTERGGVEDGEGKLLPESEGYNCPRWRRGGTLT